MSTAAKAGFAAFVLFAAAACNSVKKDDVGIFPYPLEEYVCADGTELGVRLLGERASVSVDGKPAVELPVMTSAGTTYSNGKQTLIISQGAVSWGLGRAVPQPCRAK